MNRAIFILLLAGGVSQAAVFKSPFKSNKLAVPKPDVPTEAAFHNQTAGAQAPGAEWWKGFGDPLLVELVDKAAKSNLDVRKAAARLTQAEAMRGTARSALLPTVDNNTSVTKLRGGANQGIVHVGGAPGAPQGGSFISPFDTSTISSGFNMRWELDVFGGLRKSLEASKADARAAEQGLLDMQVIVRAEVARNYVEMRGFERQMAIVEANVASEKDLLDLIRARADAGLATDLDVQRQVAQLASVHSNLPDLDAQRVQAMHRIAVLTGEEPGALVEQLEKASAELKTPGAPLAIPSEVLKRRPDVRRAEEQIAAAYARAGSARADLYPKFVITGLSGRQSTDVSGLTLGAGNFFSVGPGITLPIFTAGKTRAKIAVQDAQMTEAVRTYEQDVLAAFEETENAFVSRDRAEKKVRDLETGLKAAVRSVDLSQELYLRGLGDFISVLDAQRQRFQLERELTVSQTAVQRSTVALFKSMGE